MLWVDVQLCRCVNLTGRKSVRDPQFDKGLNGVNRVPTFLRDLTDNRRKVQTIYTYKFAKPLLKQ